MQWLSRGSACTGSREERLAGRGCGGTLPSPMGRGLAAPAADPLAPRARESGCFYRGADLRRATPRSAATESALGGSALDGDPAAPASAGRAPAAGVGGEPAAKPQAGGGVAPG